MPRPYGELEFDACADLHLARRVARVVARQDQERRRRCPVSSRVREVRMVRQIEEVGADLQLPASREVERVTQTGVELEEPGSAGAVALDLVVLHGVRV